MPKLAKLKKLEEDAKSPARSEESRE